MHNVWLIAKREYLERIRAKSFLIITILIPLLMGGLVYRRCSGQRPYRLQPRTSQSSPPTPSSEPT